MKLKRAILIIIGNEILSGRTKDKNIFIISKKLFANGILLEKVTVIPDIIKIIKKEILENKLKFDYIITTGGIGPTHDDVTAESISLALKKKYCLNNDALNELKKYYKKIKSDLTDARKKMAFMPKGSKLIKNKLTGAPGFNIENIYVFAGIPSIVDIMMDEFLKTIKIENKFFNSKIKTKFHESQIAHILKYAENKYKDINIGSYPIFDGKPKGVEIVINSLNNEKNVIKAKNYIKRELNNIN